MPHDLLVDVRSRDEAHDLLRHAPPGSPCRSGGSAASRSRSRASSCRLARRAPAARASSTNAGDRRQPRVEIGRRGTGPRSRASTTSASRASPTTVVDERGERLADAPACAARPSAGSRAPAECAARRTRVSAPVTEPARARGVERLRDALEQRLVEHDVARRRRRGLDRQRSLRPGRASAAAARARGSLLSSGASACGTLSATSRNR